MPSASTSGKDEGLRVRATLEPDAGEGPDRAVRAVAADDVARADAIQTAAAVPQRRDNLVGPGHELDQLDATFDGHVLASEVVPENALGFGLGKEQQVRVGRVGETEIEQGHSHVAAASVQAQPHRSIAVLDQGAGNSQPREYLERAGLDAQRPRLVHAVESPVDHAGPDAMRGQLAGQRQSRRSGTHHKDVDRLPAHGLTL
jgi:hypothetical protein